MKVEDAWKGVPQSSPEPEPAPPKKTGTGLLWGSCFVVVLLVAIGIFVMATGH
jgi:hypothetical protein